MKKSILAVLLLAVTVVFSGCAGNKGNSLENVDIADAPDASTIKYSDYNNDLEGLEKYLVALGYIPEKASPTEMMYSVIGAKDGDRYNFTVNGNTMYVELYEYDVNELNSDAQRVIDEIKKDGKFHVFADMSINDNVAIEAELSYTGKFMLVYNGSTGTDELKQRKDDFTRVVKEFHRA